MGYKDWCTPPDFFAELDKEFHFTLDAAASHNNHLLPTYCTKDGLFNQFGAISWEVDGLTYNWNNERVFCNPPYDSSLSKWVEKAAKFEADVAVLLLPPNIDTAWFHEFIYDEKGFNWDGHVYSCVKSGVEIRFLKGRLKFWKDGKPGPSPRQGNMLAIFK